MAAGASPAGIRHGGALPGGRWKGAGTERLC